MATIQSNGTGGGSWTAGATWNGGVAPAALDNVIIVTPDVVTLDFSDDVTDYGNITINTGGKLQHDIAQNTLIRCCHTSIAGWYSIGAGEAFTHIHKTIPNASFNRGIQLETTANAKFTAQGEVPNPETYMKGIDTGVQSGDAGTWDYQEPYPNFVFWIMPPIPYTDVNPGDYIHFTGPNHNGESYGISNVGQGYPTANHGYVFPTAFTGDPTYANEGFYFTRGDATGTAIGDAYLTVNDETGFGIGDLIQYYYDNSYQTNRSDEGFRVYDVDTNKIYIRHFVGREGTLAEDISIGETDWTVNDGEIWQINDKIIIGTVGGSDIEVLTISAVSGNVITVSSPAYAHLTGVKFYETGREKVGASGTSYKVYKTAYCVTTAAVAAASTISVADIGTLVAGDEIVVEGTAGSDDFYCEKKVIDSIAANQITIVGTWTYAHAIGCYLVKLNRSVKVMPTTALTNSNPWIYAVSTSNYRLLQLKYLEIEDMYDNSSTTLYSGLCIRGDFNADYCEIRGVSLDTGKNASYSGLFLYSAYHVTCRNCVTYKTYYGLMNYAGGDNAIMGSFSFYNYYCGLYWGTQYDEVIAYCYSANTDDYGAYIGNSYASSYLNNPNYNSRHNVVAYARDPIICTSGPTVARYGKFGRFHFKSPYYRPYAYYSSAWFYDSKMDTPVSTGARGSGTCVVNRNMNNGYWFMNYNFKYGHVGYQEYSGYGLTDTSVTLFGQPTFKFYPLFRHQGLGVGTAHYVPAGVTVKFSCWLRKNSLCNTVYLYAYSHRSASYLGSAYQSTNDTWSRKTVTFTTTTDHWVRFYVVCSDSDGNFWISRPTITFNGAKQHTEYMRYFPFGTPLDGNEDLIFLPNRNGIALFLDDTNPSGRQYYMLDNAMKDIDVSSISYNSDKQLSQIVETDGASTKTTDFVYDSEKRLQNTNVTIS